MRKRILLFAAVLMLLPSAVTVQAHGHHGGGHHNAARKSGRCITYSQCTVAKCRKNGKHKHNGKYYYGHATGLQKIQPVYSNEMPEEWET